ncbi:hypothetical protein [uncultured Microbacterium sp.]|uniref:hypothetical protein n=1 Tax=uncultured Microbacterium sp. TaxID=191216 RepID=UPI0025F3951D|nr:hypothetical protein [uncultured Microbacterium sp.]
MTTNRPTRFPVGAISSAVAALVCAVPTLVFPADSPIGPKLVLAVIAAILFGVAVILVRREGRTSTRHDGSDDPTES